MGKMGRGITLEQNYNNDNNYYYYYFSYFYIYSIYYPSSKIQ